MNKFILFAFAFTLIITPIIVIHDTLYPAEDSQIIWTCATDGDRVCGDGAKVMISVSELFDWPSPIDIYW